MSVVRNTRKVRQHGLDPMTLRADLAAKVMQSDLLSGGDPSLLVPRYTDTVNNVLVLNGPNLGRLGSREPDVYGNQDIPALRALLEGEAPAGTTIDLRQTDDEGTLIGWLHEAFDSSTPVILNPAAFTHYSYGLRDAAAMVTKAGIPLVEVHISNPHAREEFRHSSVISGIATGVIAGFGFDSYLLALGAIVRITR